MDAPLQAYLEIAYNYFLEDRLELAMQVARDGSQTQGWPLNAWIEFYNELQCESDARAASEKHQIGEKLTLEIVRGTPPSVVEHVRASAERARSEIVRILGVELIRPILITVFLPDAPVGFISGSHGYTFHKAGLDKVCIPHSALEPREGLDETMLHEFTHAASYLLAGDELPRWLDEGLATHICGDAETRQGRFLISTSARTGKLLNLAALEGLLGSSEARMDDPAEVNAAYFLAGSFVGFWAGRHGIGSVKTALQLIGRGSSPERAVRKAAGEPLSALVEAWRQSLGQA